MKSPRPSLPMTGGRQCDAICYEIASFPLLLYTCDCTDCQRQTGSAFVPNMPVRFKDFRILQGERKRWHHTSPNGTPVISRGFAATAARGWFRSECFETQPNGWEVCCRGGEPAGRGFGRLVVAVNHPPIAPCVAASGKLFRDEGTG